MWAVRALLALAVLAAGSPAARAGSLPGPVACYGCYAPALVTSWQWQLQGKVDTSVDVQMYDIDGFDASRSLVTRLHADGRKAVCYLSAGSWEDWRPDAGDFPARVLGRDNGWPGERWLDIRALRVLRPIMRARLDMCRRKGFDAVEFDNVDGYQNRTGFPLTRDDQLRYNVFLANQAHRRGMSAVLKNDLGQVRALLPYFDFALNEECFRYSECDKLTPFVKAGKAVFGVEYGLAVSDFCPEANAMDFNFLKKKLPLRAWRIPCR
ncbi:MAG: endo alpha-1,4 polygalactosaminidase [Actinobacteria bacterium]|nr:endo alpha-1,4 polygalactosaminidase [Actinomycetota bacterium]